MELMVVVMLVAILAMLATPSFVTARNDRAAFDYARQYQQAITRARARAAGTGAAHLALLGPGADNRGYVRIFAAADGDAKPAPVSSCKQDGQWTDVKDSAVSLTSLKSPFLEFVDLNSAGINKDMDLKTEFKSGIDGLGSPKFIAICIAPSGTTYVGVSTASGDSGAAGAIAAMQDSAPFSNWASASVQRHDGSGNPIGLARQVIITGGAAPRIHSQ